MTGEFLSLWRARVEERLDLLIPRAGRWPERLHAAMRYSLFAGGKRLRPVLALAAAGACGGDLDAVLPAACGLELIHTYSLIHDDLPALDDDDWRRGCLTCHRKFDEATAILAGDALLTHGLGALASHPEGAKYETARLRAVEAVVAAIGSEGMIGGQAEDLEAEREGPGGGRTPERLRRIHEHKTGDLIAASAALGGILSLAPETRVAELRAYGRSLGLAFQIKDDLLDVESSREALGKAAGKDAAQGKLTFPALLGVAESHRILEATAEEARESARRIEGGGGPLSEIASFVALRGN